MKQRRERTTKSRRKPRRSSNSVKYLPDSKIDFSDVPEMTADEMKRARPVGRPRTGNAKDLIAIRISPRLLQQLRRIAAKRNKPYQTLIYELLEEATAKQVA